MSFTYKYPRPCVTTDCLIFRKIDGNWHLLLIERGNEPFKGCWALPGGFLEMEEDLDTCAARELQEETGLTGIEYLMLWLPSAALCFWRSQPRPASSYHQCGLLGH